MTNRDMISPDGTFWNASFPGDDAVATSMSDFAKSMVDHIKQTTKPGDKVFFETSNETFELDEHGNLVSTGFVEGRQEVWPDRYNLSDPQIEPF